MSPSLDKQTELYDDSTLVYTERGTVITITVNAKGVSMKQTEQQAAPQEAAAVNNPLLDHSRKYLIQADKAAPLLREIGILTADGKIKNDMIRKYNQIDHYVELVAPMFEQDDSEEILLLDCACGKSYLSFVMNYYLRDVLRRRCRIIGIDINPHVVSESQKMAKRLGYHNMEFIAADLRTYQPPKQVTAAQAGDCRHLSARVRHCDRPCTRNCNPCPGKIHCLCSVLSQRAA